MNKMFIEPNRISQNINLNPGYLHATCTYSWHFHYLFIVVYLLSFNIYSIYILRSVTGPMPSGMRIVFLVISVYFAEDTWWIWLSFSLRYFAFVSLGSIIGLHRRNPGKEEYNKNKTASIADNFSSILENIAWAF